MEVISGQYSPVGRQTERSLRRLRTQVEAEEALLLPKTPKAEDSKQNEPDSPKSEKINLDRFPWPNSPSKAGKLNRSGTLGFNLTGSTVATLNGTNGSFEETTNKSEEKDEEASKSLKASVAFSAMGQDAGQLCEVARSKYRRFMLPSRDSRPEAGHYRVNDSCSFQRPPEWDIGQRPLHQGRKVRAKDTGMELGEMYNGFADGLASQGKFQPMALSPWRPDVTSLCTHPMTFAPAHQKEWCKLDAASSQSTRAPDWDFQKHMQGHHFDLHMSFPYFEPGKYKVEMKNDVSGLPFSKGMTRAQSAGEMKSDGMGPTSRLVPDRSHFRGCAAAVRRKTCIQDFSQDLDRPPLLVTEPPAYDEDDPEVVQKVLERQLAFDASTADRMIVSRCHTPSMKAGLDRDQALRGARILGCDPGLQRSMGIGILNLDSKTGTELHDEFRWQRSDTGLAFSQMSGRYSAPVTTRIHSSLRRPKSEVTFSFKRSACPGFTTRASVQKINIPSEANVERTSNDG